MGRYGRVAAGIAVDAEIRGRVDAEGMEKWARLFRFLR